MAALDLASAAGVLKDYYLPTVRNQINQKVPFLEQIERGSEHVEGEQWVLSLHVARNPGVGARREGGTLPTAGRQGYKKARGDVFENTGRFEVTAKSIDALSSDKGGYVRAVESQTKGLVNDLRRDVNRQLFGTSNGVFATCGETTTSDTVQLATSTPLSAMRQLEVGMVIDIGTVASPTAVASARTIESTDVANRTITISGADVSTTASTHFVFRAGSGGDAANGTQAEVTGLQTIIAASGSLHDVDPATYPLWVSTVHNNTASPGTARAVTTRLFRKLMNDVEIASGEEIDQIWASYGVADEYGDDLETQKRFPNTIDLKGGHKGLEVTAGGKSAGLARDRDVPDGNAFFINTSHLFSPEMSDWEWEDRDGAVLRMVDDKHSFEALLYKFHELVTDQRNAHGLLTDLDEGTS